MRIKEVFGENINLKRDFKISLYFLAGFIILNILIPSIVIGFPLAPVATSPEQFALVGVVAPLGEELGFRVGLLSLFSWLPFPVNALINAVVFSLFHWTAYGTSLAAMNGAFIGALLFALVACFIIKKYDSVLPCIFLHAGFNIFLLMRYYIVPSLELLAIFGG